jgi:DnaJ family protein A protein 3
VSTLVQSNLSFFKIRCPQCSGTGMETVSTGPFLMRSTCRRCHGKGSWNKHPCKECAGAGQTKQRQKVKVPVPAGIENGQTVRMPVGSKEIFITFHVDSSDYFRRQGSDLHTDAKISLSQAALGGAIRVEGIYEDLNVQLPLATASHTRMRMAGKGIKKVSGYGYGDHYIHIRIEPPKKMDEKQRALLQAFAETEADTPGTVTGLTYTKEGTKVVMEDPDGLVGELRDLLNEHSMPNNKDKAN